MRFYPRSHQCLRQMRRGHAHGAGATAAAARWRRAAQSKPRLRPAEVEAVRGSRSLSMYSGTYIYIRINIYMFIHLYICIYIYVCIWAYTYMYVYRYIQFYIKTYIHVQTYAFTHTHMSTQACLMYVRVHLCIQMSVLVDVHVCT